MTRKLAISLAALALAAVLAGCGAETASEEAAPSPAPPAVEPPAAEVPVAEAAAKTAEVGSARMEMSATMAFPGLAEPASFSAEGVFDFERQRGRMTLDYSGLIAALGPAADQARGAFPDVMVFDDLVMYMRFPGLKELIPDAKLWMRMDLRELAAQQGVDLELYSQFNQTDPSQTLQYLQAAGSDVEELGTEKVRGVETTHYRATIDLAKVPDFLPEEMRDAYRKSMETLVEQTGQSTIPIEAWIGEDGLVRRVSSDFSFSLGSASDSTSSMSWTVDLYDFGVDVAVKLPPAGKVMDFSELLAYAGR